MEEDEFQKQDKSIISTKFWIFRLSELSCKEKSRSVFNFKSFTVLYFFSHSIMVRRQPVNAKPDELDYREKSISFAYFETV